MLNNKRIALPNILQASREAADLRPASGAAYASVERTASAASGARKAVGPSQGSAVPSKRLGARVEHAPRIAVNSDPNPKAETGGTEAGRSGKAAQIKRSADPIFLLRMMRGILVIAFLILALGAGWLALPYWRSWRSGVAAERESTRGMREALERLRNAEPKDPADLALAQDLLYKAKDWSSVTSLLNEPDLQGKGIFKIWDLSTGYQELQGIEFKAYREVDSLGSGGGPLNLIPVLLFRVEEDGAVCCLGSHFHVQGEVPKELLEQKKTPALAPNSARPPDPGRPPLRSAGPPPPDAR